MTARTTAEQLDRLLDSGESAPGGDLRPLLVVADALRAALPPVPASRAFERHLASRLARPGNLTHLARRAELAARTAARGHRRLIAAGAVSSFAGAAVTVAAVWMVSRRGTGARGIALRPVRR